MLYGGGGLLLLSAVAGYWVLERAETHKGSLRRSGRVVGWIIIVSSFVGLICRIACATNCPIGMPGGMGFCPFGPKSGMPAAPLQ